MKSQKHNFINWRIKVLILFIFITFWGIVSGQTSTKEKNKTPNYKDSLNKNKSDAAKTEKILAIIDTVKKIKPLFEQQQAEVDSLFIGKGIFKFYKKNAHASYYANKFHNHKTASGKKYDKNKYSAAHKRLAFGTIVKVTNEANGKSVIVEITDRGPFVRSREIDLSRRAFMEIASNTSSGNIKVTLEILQK